MELKDEFELGITVDIKMAQLIFGVMGGNGKYPCPLCVWCTDDGVSAGMVYAARTRESLEQNFIKLQDKYGGNPQFSKKCDGVEARASLPCDPGEVLKMMSLHLLLLTNTLYKFIKTNCTDEELAVFEVLFTWEHTIANIFYKLICI